MVKGDIERSQEWLTVSSATNATIVNAKPKTESLEFFMVISFSDSYTLYRRKQPKKVTGF